MLVFAPVLIDAISASLTDDPWDMSPVANYIPNPSQSSREIYDPYSHLTSDPSLITRGYVVQEILATEQTYFQELGILKNVIKKKLIELKIISQSSINVIFSGIDHLYDLHSTILYEFEEACSLDTWQRTMSMIGDIFLTHASEFETAYVLYIDGKHNADITLKREIASSGKNFRVFLDICSKSRETKKTDLAELLLRPMSRATRYPILLRELEKQTPVDHPDKIPLSQALKTMTEIATKVDNRMHSSQQAALLFQTRRETHECPQELINGDRTLLADFDAFLENPLPPLQQTSSLTSRTSAVTSSTLTRSATVSTTATTPIYASGGGTGGFRCRLFLCSDLLMVTAYIRVPAPASKFFGGNTSGVGVAASTFKYQFVRFIDFRDVEDVSRDSETGADTLRIRMMDPSSVNSEVAASNGDSGESANGGQQQLKISLSTRLDSRGQLLPLTIDLRFDMAPLSNRQKKLRDEFVTLLQNKVREKQVQRHEELKKLKADSGDNESQEQQKKRQE
ncbi:Protein T2 [Physocladia obscura]|uniref:Protein T2 n=1 Tax=Physocladia obscura TaxID=109957 RepID=A0AAD5XFU3_9FUNG|nr:Protein T2 [Physocladia obscura]